VPEHPYRWLFTGLFALLTLFAAVGTAVGRWTHDTLFDTEAWLEVVGPISSDPVVSDALSDVVSRELIEFLDPTVRLQKLLPDQLDRVAVEMGTAIEGIIVDETEKFFESELFDELWLGLNELVHPAVVAIIRDQVPFASTAGGVVTVDLEPLLTPIIDSVLVAIVTVGEQIPDVILDQIDVDETVSELAIEYETDGLPESLNNVVVYQSDRLAAIQQTVSSFDRLVVFLPWLTLILAVATVAFAPSRLVMIPIMIFGGALAWFLSLIIVDAIIASALGGIDSADATDVASALLEGITASLDDLLRILIISALVIGGAAVGVVWRFRRSNEEPIEA
jgi:hypothetical protein